jgi:hypothetical protein
MRVQRGSAVFVALSVLSCTARDKLPGCSCTYSSRKQPHWRGVFLDAPTFFTSALEMSFARPHAHLRLFQTNFWSSSASDVRTALLETGEVDVANSMEDSTVTRHLVLSADLVSSLHDAGDCSGPIVI